MLTCHPPLFAQMHQQGDYTCLPPGYAHGVIGQTLTRAPVDPSTVTVEQAGDVGSYQLFHDGDMPDYSVDNLWGTGFKYNR